MGSALSLILILNLVSSCYANAELENQVQSDIKSDIQSEIKLEAPLRIEKLGPICGKLIRVNAAANPTASAAAKSTAKSTAKLATNAASKKPHFSGVADYYADQFHGRKTASGQIHDKNKYTAAHLTLPFGTKLKVVSRHTGKTCVVTVNDRGPFTKSRIIDLSVAAARELGLITAKSRLVDCYIVED